MATGGLIYEDHEASMYAVGDGTVNIFRKDNVHQQPDFDIHNEAFLDDDGTYGDEPEFVPSVTGEHALHQPKTAEVPPRNSVQSSGQAGLQSGSTIAIQSDADTGHRPDPSHTTAVAAPVDKYIKALQKLWVNGGGDSGQVVGIPAGYLLVSFPRANQTARPDDRFLYGHPARYRFESPNQFFPHLKYLINKTKGENEECTCKGCQKLKRSRK